MYRPRNATPEGESGSALILALFFAIVTMGIVMSGSIQMQADRQKTQTTFQLHGQANQFARSGLIEAMTWFRRQTTQPVTTFWPEVDTLATPPIVDTIDDEVGIVREFKITGSTWGRYEVWKEWDADTDSTRLAWRNQMKCADVSTTEGFSTEGMSWRLRSIGYVFERPEVAPGDPEPAFEDLRVLTSSMLEAEILRLSITPPAQAALCLPTGSACRVNSGGEIDGGSTAAGCFYGRDTGSPSGSSRIAGTPRTSTPASGVAYDGDCEAVFGVEYDTLQTVAESYIESAANFPSPVPTNALTVANVSSITFDNSRPLSGTGVVYVRGNVTIAAGSVSNFNGLLFVDGNLTVNAPATLTGAVVCTQNVTLQGSGDYAQIVYDDDILNALRLEIGKYRLAGAIRPIIAHDE